MYYILYSNDKGNPMWEFVDGEDEMQIRVDELCKRYNLYAEEDIIVFDAEDEIR